MPKNVLAICALLWAQSALANQITQVSAHDGSIRIAADEPPNFTTFTIDYPPRLVVDIAGATLVDVPTNIPVGQGGVQSIQTLPYGSGSSAVARVIIMYDKPVQTDILTDGNSIVVRQAEASAPPPAAPLVASAGTTPPAAPGPKAAQQAAPPPPSPAPPPEPEPPSPQLAAAVPASPRPAAREPAVAPPPPAQPPRNAENAAPPPAPPPVPSPPPAEVATQNPPPEEPAAQLPEPAPVEPAPPPPQPPPPPPQPMAAAPALAVPSPPPPMAPAAVPELNPPAEAPAPSQPVLARTEAPVPLRLNTQAELASPPPPPPSEEPPRVTARRKTLSLVGLRFNNGATSVFVRTNEPVSYRVSERPNGLVITIENTRIRRRNDMRPLDAEYFDSPVAKVKASQNRGDVEVNIDLKAHAAYQATQSGREVELSFGKQG